MTGFRTAASRIAGFTLIEMLAATLLTSIVIGVAVSLYINLSNATTVATARTRETRNATAILDRVARDLEGAFLLDKPDEVDPLEHPWFFVAESRESSAGSDHMKFVTRNHRSASTEGHTSEVGIVSYALSSEYTDRADGFALVRAHSSRLPERLDLSIPALENEGAVLVADGIDSFDVLFLNGNGLWAEEWDSTQLEESSSLPVAAEIRVALTPSSPSLNPDFEPEIFARRVVLPLRPLSIDLIVQEASAVAAQSVLEAEREIGELEKEWEGEPPASNCEMTFTECFNIPRNNASIRASLGSGESYELCRQNVANMPVCVEEYPAAKLCGVPIQCWH